MDSLLAQGTIYGIEKAPSPLSFIENQPADSSGLTTLPIYVGVVIVFIGLGLLTARFILRRMRNRYDPFEMVALRILLPKESLEAEGEMRNKDMRELIAPTEGLMANLAGLRAERGIASWLAGRKDTFSFEIVVLEGVISFYVVVPASMRQYVEQQIQAQHPDAQIEERRDYNIFLPNGAIKAVSLRCIKTFLFPIKTYQEAEADPLNSLTNALSKFRDQEGGALIQYVVRSAHPKWHAAGNTLAREVRQGRKLSDAVNAASGGFVRSAWHAMSKGSKRQLEQQERFKGLSQYEEEALARIQKKSSKSAFEANIRVVVSARDEHTAQSSLNGIVDSFAQYAGFEYANKFAPVKPRNMHRFMMNVVYRQFSERTIMIFNTEEMTSLFHFPLPTTETPNILWLGAKLAPAPVNIPREGIVLGHTEYRGEDTVIRVKDEDRRRHMYIIGKSGSGKSVLLSNVAKQDIDNGHGVCVIDPHGDLVDTVLSYVPPARFEDVIYFDPSDMAYPMGLNMLEYREDSQKDFAVQEMIAIFMKLFPPEMIGPMFEHNMRNVMLTLMADKEHPGTIIDIPRMFTDSEYQKYKISKVTDPAVLQFWEQEMAKTSDFHKSEMLGYLISKVGRFVENEMMRNIIGQPKSAFNFREVMDQKKILLINLAKGKTGEVNSALLGLIIVAKLQMAAMTRAELPEAERHDFYLYVDEFQNFVTDSIATILSEARKYRLDLIIAHQYVGQLVDNGNTSIRDAVFGNVGTIMSFKIGVEDAETLAKEFAPTFNEYDVINIPQYHAYTKLLIDNTASKPFQMKTYPPPAGDSAIVDKLKEYSRLKYGVERAVIEKSIVERVRIAKSASQSLGASGESSRA